jgi:predicted phage tail protein
MFRVIKVYGKLAKHVGQRSFKAAVKSPAEAIRFLLANFPDLRGVMSEGDYKISVGRSELEIGDHPEYIHLPSASFEPIRIIPVIAGAQGGTGKILAGVGLIAAAILLAPVGGGFLGLGQSALGAIGPFAGGLTQGFILGSAASTAIGAVGAALVLGGVAQLMTPTPKLTETNSRGIDQESDPRRSFSFSGVQNVSRQGVPVPVIYGEVFTGSVVITASLNVEEVTG